MNGSGAHMTKPKGALLVGSVPLTSREEVFRTVSSVLPGRLHSIPDGETGERQSFVWWQAAAFKDYPDISFAKTFDKDTLLLSDAALDNTLAKIERKGGIKTGYDDHALASYKSFIELREEGVIPKDVKFQVCLPTPLNALMMITPAYRVRLEPLYTAALLKALDNVQSTIPADDLVIQWDCAREFALLEGLEDPILTPGFDESMAEREGAISARIASLVNAVHPDVEVGVHCCYGDSKHTHFIEPKDLSIAVSLVNLIAQNVSRPINYIHMPVPKDIDSQPYLAPLSTLDHLLQQQRTKVYLGVVHAEDSEGTQARIETASELLGKMGVNFGLSTECGLGRTPGDQIPGILKLMHDSTGLL
ncbi:uncharacterized protein AB675_1822 [Cyphellophora attinorum]|uniref:Cobalamin-independent methionine synthase MetE C-terminal/archaeal domain-containing protein n=1 Tax=Cyphellophora attinorum TaxID=1664694 RepID=A0A0N1HDQ4_9EURO|nr:uncharacterized protein AB675_1822 [Phialophora attinorum]KPI42853.1 hypothetical protein AB675_1822 [Phialophora attinorum]